MSSGRPLLKMIKEKYEDFLLSLKGNVTLVAYEGTKITGGKDTGQPCITIGVVKKLPPEELLPRDEFWRYYNAFNEVPLAEKRRADFFITTPKPIMLPAKLETALVDVVETGEFVIPPLMKEGKSEPKAPEDHRKKFRPQIPSGVSMIAEGSTACTFSGYAIDKSRNRLVKVQCYHCQMLSDGSPVPVGHPTLQPSPYDGGTSADAVAKRAQKIIHVKDSERIDLAILDEDNPEHFTKQVFELGEIVGKAVMPFAPGERLYKSGRTTGVNYSEVANADASVVINYGFAYLTKKHQIVTRDAIMQGGDSSSPGLRIKSGTIPNAQLEIGAIGYAGGMTSSIFFHIADAENEYNIDFDISKWQPPTNVIKRVTVFYTHGAEPVKIGDSCNIENDLWAIDWEVPESGKYTLIYEAEDLEGHVTQKETGEFEVEVPASGIVIEPIYPKGGETIEKKRITVQVKVSKQA